MPPFTCSTTGFQHFQLDRDADIVLVNRADLNGARTLPGGHLRELPDVLIAADAIVSLDPDVAVDTPHAATFLATRLTGEMVFEGQARPTTPPRRVLAVAGVADPDPFFEAVGRAMAGKSRQRRPSAITIPSAGAT